MSRKSPTEFPHLPKGNRSSTDRDDLLRSISTNISTKGKEGQELSRFRIEMHDFGLVSYCSAKNANQPLAERPPGELILLK